jgi:hypothetical protein
MHQPCKNFSTTLVGTWYKMKQFYNFGYCMVQLSTLLLDLIVTRFWNNLGATKLQLELPAGIKNPM